MSFFFCAACCRACYTITKIQLTECKKAIIVAVLSLVYISNLTLFMYKEVNKNSNIVSSEIVPSPVVKELTPKEIFIRDKEIIISEIKALIESKQYLTAVKLGEKYSEFDDEDIKLWIIRAKSAGVKALGDRQKVVDPSNFAERLEIVSGLSELIPESETFKETIIILTKKIESQKVSNTVSSRSSLYNPDGSHKGLVQYVKDHMNDPNSFEHVETKSYNTSNGLLVRITWRGKNKFGGVVTNSILRRISSTGKVLE